MKVDTVILVVLSVVSACFGETLNHPDTKEEGCIDGVCGSVCSYEGMQIFPGQIYEVPRKCIIYKCSEDFTVFVEGCDYDDGEVSDIGRDVSKSFPECCGTTLKPVEK